MKWPKGETQRVRENVGSRDAESAAIGLGLAELDSSSQIPPAGAAEASMLLRHLRVDIWGARGKVVESRGGAVA